ncbi:MAG: hypothetical protein MPJ27_08545, partial [Pirellulales bacterium]|nr:hypothetical protein [Pirellulales bacterium]
NRIDLRIRALLDVARSQSQINKKLVNTGQLRASYTNQNEPLTSEDFPRISDYFLEVMKVHKELAYLSLAIEATGEYCMLEQKHDSIISRRYIRNAENQIEIHDYEYSDNGEIKYEISEYNNYDPRKRPWYVAAKKAGQQTWPDSFVFWGTDAASTTPGKTCATPIYSNGELEYVLTADFELRDLSKFLKNQIRVGHSGKGRPFIIERRSDDTMRVVAHPQAELLTELIKPVERDEETVTTVVPGQEMQPTLVPIERFPDPVVQAFIQRLPKALTTLPRSFKTKKQVVSFSFRVGSEKFIGSYQRLRGSNYPDWITCMVMPESDVLGSVQRNNLVNLIIGLTAFVITSLMCVLLSTRISSPLRTVAVENERIGTFDLTTKTVGRSRITEVDQLLIATEAMKKSLRSFAKYVPTELVRELVSSQNEAQLGGQRATLTVYFSDIQDFTSISEKLTAEDLVDHLEDYLTAMSKQISRDHGTIDKYIGDAVMAFWGAPIPNKNHAIDACRAALANQHNLQELCKKWRDQGKPELWTRIGISSGELVIGNMGSEERLNYTVIGNPVNLASRLESLNKVYGTKIIISQKTKELVSDIFVVRPLDLVAVKGQEVGNYIYELIGFQKEAAGKTIELVEEYEAALTTYIDSHFQEAAKQFESITRQFPDDAPATLLLKRCLHLCEHPPLKWDGVHRMSFK